MPRIIPQGDTPSQLAETQSDGFWDAKIFIPRQGGPQ